MATQSIQNHKKFDFKLNLQNLNEPHQEDEFCIYCIYFRKQAPQFSYRKAQLNIGERIIQYP